MIESGRVDDVVPLIVVTRVFLFVVDHCAVIFFFHRLHLSDVIVSTDNTRSTDATTYTASDDSTIPLTLKYVSK